MMYIIHRRCRFSLTHSYIGIQCSCAPRRDHIRSLQPRGRASTAGNPKLSRAEGTAGGRHCEVLEAGAAFSLETSASSQGCGIGACAPGRTKNAVSNQRRGDPAAARMDQYIRTLLDSAVESHKGTSRTNQ